MRGDWDGNNDGRRVWGEEGVRSDRGLAGDVCWSGIFVFEGRREEVVGSGWDGR